jgi:hypothetical protein
MMTKATIKKTVDEDTGIRYDENGVPLLVITYQIKKFCHQAIQEETSEGEAVDVKMRATQPFLNELNKTVYSILLECLTNARREGRTNLAAADVPKFEEPPTEG